MLRLDQIQGEQVKAAVQRAAVERGTAVVVVPYQNRVLSFRVKQMSVTDGQLFLEMSPPPPISLRQVLVANPCHVLIRHRAYRYMCEVSLQAASWNSLGQAVEGFSARLGERLNRYDRRIYTRVDVPSGRSFRAHIRVEGLESLNWSGPVLNLSQGGVQVRTQGSLLDVIEPGDLIALAILFGPQAEPVNLTAYFRGGRRDGDMALMGFEFAEASTSPQFAASLQAIAKFLQELQGG